MASFGPSISKNLQALYKTEKFWDRLAPQFDRRSGEGEPTLVKKAKKYLRPSDKVLDLGCATGTITVGVAGYVRQVKGIDISSKMIEIARQKAETRKVRNIEFNQMTLFDEKLTDQTFDVILALNVLHLVEKPQGVIRRLNKLLKPGGLLIAETPCMGERTPFILLQWLLFRPLMGLGVIPRMNFFTLAGLQAKVSGEHFEILHPESEKEGTNYFMVARKREL